VSDIREAIKAMPKGDVAVVVSASSLNGAGFRTEALQALLDRLEKLEGAARDAVHMLDDDCPVAAQATLREALK
jgi:regulator of RNase E activity RraA